MVSPDTKQGLEPRVAERIKSLTPFAKSDDVDVSRYRIVCKRVGVNKETQELSIHPNDTYQILNSPSRSDAKTRNPHMNHLARPRKGR